MGGGIANFTDVAKTFTGIIRALREATGMLLEQRVTVWVRRGGPNYQEGLKLMREAGAECGLDMHVFGPDTHITAIVALALGKPEALAGLRVEEEQLFPPPTPAAGLTAVSPRTGGGGGGGGGGGTDASLLLGEEVSHPTVLSFSCDAPVLSPLAATQFSHSTRCVVFGMQRKFALAPAPEKKKRHE